MSSQVIAYVAYETLQEVSKGVPKSFVACKYNVLNNTLST